MQDILQFIIHHLEITLIGAITLVEFVPIKVNPWSALLHWIRKMRIGDLPDKVDDLGNKIDQLDSRLEEHEAVSARSRIQRFGDEIYHGKRHSKDHFESILLDIDNYNSYCEKHPEFKNNVTETTTEQIRDCYKRQVQTNDFL